MVIALPLVTCFAWGVADYIAGVKSRGLAVLTITLISQAVGLALLTCVLVVRGAAADPTAALVPTAIAATMAVALPLVASLAIASGFADRIASLKRHRLALLTLIVIAQVVGLVLLVSVLAMQGTGSGANGAIIPALIAGAFTATGLVTLYRALAIGPISIAAPISATGGVVPVVAGAVALGESPPSFQWAGIAIAIAGAALAALQPARAGSRGARAPLAGPVLAVVAALSFGLSFVAIDRASESDVVLTATAVHVAALLVTGLAVGVFRAPTRVPHADLPAIAAIGALGALGHLFLAWATSIGWVAIVGVLASLYPVPTVVLAQLVGGERVTNRQGAGVVLALGGVAVLGAA
jgi:drug/metabolite transporter (DMT)-like permease